MARNRSGKKSPVSPLPVRDGIAPSYLNLPHGEWPDLLSFLIERFPHLPAEVLTDRLRRGELVDNDGQAFTLTSPFRQGQRVWYYREVPDEKIVPFKENILFEDELIVIADKPHWLSTIPAGRHLKETLLIRLRNRLNLPELAPSHRLDRETAGLVLLCKQPEHRGAYQTMFQKRNVQKHYQAVAPVRNDLTLPYVYRSNIVRGDTFFTMKEAEGESNSETEINLLTQEGNRGLYLLKPHTGRQHQLRVHMSALGMPLENDPWYPIVQPEADHEDYSQPLQLLAYTLEFTDPVTGQARFFRSQRQLNITTPKPLDQADS